MAYNVNCNRFDETLLCDHILIFIDVSSDITLYPLIVIGIKNDRNFVRLLNGTINTKA